MAEKEKSEGGKKPAKKHLHEIRSEQAEDGHIVHHQTYKAKKGDAHTEPERKNVAVSSSPEEAGQHVADQFAMNQSPQANGGGEPEGQDPTAADSGEGGSAGAPGEMMG